MNKIFKHKRGASGLKVVCEFAKSHCSSGEKTAVSSGAHVSTRSGFKSLSIALISALTLGIATPAMAVTFGELGNRGGSTAVGGAVAGGNNAKAQAGGSTAIGVSVTASGGNSTAIGMNAESMTGQALAVGSYARARGDQSTAIGNDVTSIGASSIAIGNDDISSVYKDNPLFTAEELAKKDIVDELDKLCAVASCETMYGLKKVGNVYVTMENDIVDNVPKYRKWSPTFTTGAGAIAIGSRTVAMSDGATAIGTLAVAAGKKSAALGSFSKATAENALAFGAESIASGTNSSVFGIGAKASKNNSMAIGTGAVSNMENSVALGVNSKTDYTGSNKKGYMPGNGYMLPMASSAGVISVGSATQPRRIVNLASGALDTDAVNVAQLKSLAENLGVDDIADNTDKTMRYLSVSRSTGSAVEIQKLIQKEKDFKTYSQYRKYHDIMVLGKKRTGTTDYDNEINELATKISNMEGKYTGFQSAIATPSGLNNISQTSSEQDVQDVTNGINAYTTTILTADEKTKIKSHNAANEGATGADAIAIGYDAKSTGAQAVSLGKTATASGTDAIAIGNGAKTKENAANAIAIGKSSNATDINTIAIGNNAKANGKSSINIGEGVAADNVLGANSVLIGSTFGDIAKTNTSLKIESSTIAGTDLKIEGKKIDKSVIIGSRHEIGQETTATNELSQNVIVGEKIRLDNSDQAVTIGSDIIAKNSKGGIAIGGDDADLVSNFPKTEIQGKGAIAIGVSANAMKDAAMSLGVNSQTTVAQGVALGFNSLANTDKGAIGLEFDTATNTLKASSKSDRIWKSTAAALSIGSDTITRQITNVAAGSADTDAVNVAQLKSVSDAISQQGFNVKGKNSAGTDDVTNSIKSGKTVEFASGNNYLKIDHTTTTDGNSNFTFNVNEEALKSIINQTSKGVTADALQGKLKAGTNIASIITEGTGSDAKVTINAKGAKVVAGNGIKVDEEDVTGDNIKKYTVGLDDATKTQLDNATTNANKSMQNLQVIANGEDGEIAKISKDDKLNFAAGNNLVATLNKDGKTVTYSMKDGVQFNNITTGKKDSSPTNKDGKDGSITVNGKDGKSVTINGKDGTIGLAGTNGADGLTIRGGKGADGVDGANGADGADGITRIIYKDANNKDHQVATLEDGLKFGGNYANATDNLASKKLNETFFIKGSDSNDNKNWGTDFDKGQNIMTQIEGGNLRVALAKALKGLTSAEFTNATGDTTTITGDKITINPNGNTEDNKKVSIGKDGISAGGNKITNIADGVNEKDAVNMKQFNELANKGVTADALQGKLKAGTNIASIITEGTGSDAKVTINAKGAKVVAGNGIKVDEEDVTGDNIKKYTVGLDDATKTQLDNATTNANKSMQNLQVIANGEDGEIAKISKDDKLNFAAGNNLVATLNKDGKTVTYSMKDGVQFNNITTGKKDSSPTNKDGKDGSITVNGKDGKSVTINGKDGTIGLAGTNGADGVVINGENHTIIAKGENGKDGVVINGKDGSIGLTGKPGVDGTSPKADIKVAKGEDGTTRIIYETPKKDGTQGVDKHEVATLDDGLKFGGNSGETYKKLNTKFDIKGAGTTWADFDQGKNIMTQVDSNGVMTIALAKALKGLTSAEFVGGTDGGKTVINGDGIKYNPKDNTDPNKEVSLGKDGINAGGKTISNVATGVNEGDAVNKKQMDEAINKAVAASNTNTTALTFVGDNGNTKAKDGEIKIVGGQTETSKLSDKPNIGVVAKDGKLDIKLAKDIAVDSVTAKNSITVGEGANKITIADGKISGITSAVDPKGELANKLKDIDKDASKSDTDKAKDKKDAIQKALENVSNGNVATVGDLKNVTNGLDSVVTNITNNVSNITSNVTNITNITSMVANQGDKQNIDKAAEASKKYQSATTDEEKQKIAEEAKEVVKNNKIKTYNPYETTVKNNTTIVEAIQNMNERGIKFIHVSAENNLGKDDNFAFDSEDSRANMKGSIGIGMSAASTAENAIATGTNSKASGENSIATGTDSQASGLNSIAMGNGAQAIGKNTISIGTGNKVTGINSGAIGDPTTLDNVNGVYSMGNDNFIQGGGKGKDNIKDPTARDIFAIGNNIGSDTKKVTDAANYSVILGSKGYSDVEKGVALGYGSNADRKALTTDKEKASAYNGENNADVRGTIRGDYGAVSVGDGDHTRQIINVAAGRDDSDAVNVAQLKAVKSQILNSAKGINISEVTFDPKTGRQVNINNGNNRDDYAPKVKNTGVNSVAIGANSVANRANTVSVGSAGNERIIANVADGVAPTDAANMRQLQSVANMVGEVKKDAMAGTASAMAIGNLPQATIPGKGMMAIGAGYYKGQTATALGVSKMSENGKWVFKASASYDSQRNVGAAGAIGFHF